MRRIALIAVSLLTLLLFAGCTGNLFMEWDKPDVPSATEISGRTVDDQSSADDFLSDAGDWYDGDALSGDGGTSGEVVKKLEDIYNDPGNNIDDETQQKSAALAGKIAIQSDPNAEQLSKNLIASFDELTSSSDVNAEEFIKSIVPQEAKSDLNVFTEMVNSLVKAADAYLALGDNVNTSGSTFISDSELGDSVQYGAVAVAVVAALDALDGDSSINGSISTDPNNDLTTTDTQALFNLVNGSGDFGGEDPIESMNDAGDTYSGMYYLLDATGLSVS